MTTKLDRVRTGLRIPMDLNTKLILMAQKRGKSKNALILDILWDYVERKQENSSLKQNM